MQSIKTLNINEFFSVATQLAFQAAAIIRDVGESKQFHKQMKDVDDPLTVADLKAQTTIITGLKHFWYHHTPLIHFRPHLRIIGEEDTDFQGDLAFDFNALNPNLLKTDLTNSLNALPINDDLVVWVDPLDGTLSFVNGELDAVTTLIGVSVGDNPLLSVIG